MRHTDEQVTLWGVTVPPENDFIGVLSTGLMNLIKYMRLLWQVYSQEV